MKISLVIQGPLTHLTFEIVKKARLSNYIGVIIISTWKNDPLEIETLLSSYPDLIILRLNEYSARWSKFNIDKQAYSTKCGLDYVTTEYAIKLRSNWPYLKFDKICEKFLESPEKILSSNIFFRPHRIHPFHCSDHLLVAKTEVLKTAFRGVVDRCERNDIHREYFAMPDPAVEQVICDELLKAMNIQERNIEIMKSSFEIVKLEEVIEIEHVNEADRWIFSTETHHVRCNVASSVDEI